MGGGLFFLLSASLANVLVTFDAGLECVDPLKSSVVEIAVFGGLRELGGVGAEFATVFAVFGVGEDLPDFGFAEFGEGFCAAVNEGCVLDGESFEDLRRGVEFLAHEFAEEGFSVIGLCFGGFFFGGVFVLGCGGGSVQEITDDQRSGGECEGCGRSESQTAKSGFGQRHEKTPLGEGTG